MAEDLGGDGQLALYSVGNDNTAKQHGNAADEQAAGKVEEVGGGAEPGDHEPSLTAIECGLVR
ncbi:hypothetical protein D3C86_2223020 [compost metagenome]